MREHCHCCGHARTVRNGEFLRWRREQHEVGLREFAREIGRSAAYLSDIERNQRTRTAAICSAYAKRFPLKEHN